MSSDAWPPEFQPRGGPASVGPILFTGDERDRDTLTRRDIVAILFKHKRLILLSTAIVTVAAAFLAFALPPTYSSGARLLIRSSQGDPAFFSGLTSAAEPAAYEPLDRRLENEMALIATTNNVAQVVEELGLTYDEVYHPPHRHLMMPLLLTWDWVRGSLLGKEVDDRRGFEATVGALVRAITVEPAPSRGPQAGSDVVDVTLLSPSGEVAEAALAALLDNYLSFRAALDQEAGVAALEIVRASAAEAAVELDEREEALRTFLASNPDAWSAVPQGNPTASSAAPADDPRLVEMNRRLVALEMELVDTRRTFLDEAPEVLILEEAVEDLEASIQREAVAGANRYAREADLRRAVRQTEVRHDELLARLSDIAFFVEVSGRNVGQRIVIEPPASDGSALKRRLLIIVPGALLGLMLGLTLAGVGEFTDPRFRSTSEVRRNLGLPVAAVVPDVGAGKDAPHEAPWEVHGNGAGRPHTVPMRELEAWLSATLPAETGDDEARTVLVTSARDGEGRSFLAFNLARHMGASRRGGVLLVSQEAHPGAVSSPEEAVAAAGVSDLVVLHLDDGDVFRDPARWSAYLERVRQAFRWVVIDGPGAFDGAAVPAATATATLLVVDATRTRRPTAIAALGRLAPPPDAVVGAVINRHERHVPSFVYERV